MAKKVFIGTEVFLDDARPDLLVIEDDVTLIARCVLLGHAYYPRHLQAALFEAGQRTGVVIKRGAYVGCQAVILPGVTIGECAVVAAGSVVAEDVKPLTVVAGAPAREIRKLTPDSVTTKASLACLPQDSVAPPVGTTGG